MADSVCVGFPGAASRVAEAVACRSDSELYGHTGREEGCVWGVGGVGVECLFGVGDGALGGELRGWRGDCW